MPDLKSTHEDRTANINTVGIANDFVANNWFCHICKFTGDDLKVEAINVFKFVFTFSGRFLYVQFPVA